MTDEKLRSENEQISILYVDDEEDLLTLCKLFLERSGEFKVETMNSALQALKSSQIHSFDTIISDYQMPMMDGIEFLKRLKTEGNLTPFILFTGKGREEVVIEALNNGADFYLQKGGDPAAQFAELSNKIRHTVLRRRAESELLESQKKIADIIDFFPDATFAINNEGVVIAWNRAMEVMTGIRKDDMIGKGDYAYTVPFYGTRRKQLLDLIDREDNEITSLYQSLQRDGQNIYAEAFTPALFGGKGAYIWVTGAPLYDIQNKRIGAIESIRDITDRKQIEQALQESEERYRNVVEEQTEFITRFLPDGTHVFVNDAYCKYFGFTREEIIGRRFKPDIPSEDIEQLQQFFDSLTPEHPADIIEHRIIMPNGSIRWQRWSDHAIFNTSGKLVEYQSVGQDITNNKRAEVALIESEKKYRTLFETTGTATTLLENDGTICLANSEFERLSGYSKDEIENKKTWMEFVVTEDIEMMRTQHHLRRQNHEKALMHYEFRFQSRSGKIHYIFLTIDVIPDTLQSVASLLDISDRKKVEDELIAANKEYINLLNQIQTVYYRSDIEGRLIRASNSWALLLGYNDLSECIGRNIAEDFYFNPGDRDKFLEEVYKNGVVSGYEVTLKKKTGEPVVVLTASHLNYNSAGEILGVEGTFQDITDRKLAEKALIESEKQYRDIYENAVIGIFKMSLEGKIISANSQAAKLLKYDTADELIQSVPDVISQVFLDPLTGENARQIIRKTGYLKNFEAQFRCKNGETMWGMLNSRLVKDENGIILYHEIISQDITDRKRAEEALRQANRKLNLMTSITRHDIQNKITTILSFLYLAKEDINDPNLADYCKWIESATKQIQSQIEFTRIYQDIGTTEPQWQKLEPILDRLPITDALVFESDVHELELYADAMLEKVFFNLLDNSIRHGENVTEIRVFYRADHEGITIIWEDNGIGIPDDMKEQIFERGVGKNTGLGLFLIHEILSITGMSIRETGKAGKGATFEIFIPNGTYRNI
ncbi:MAG: PAS domain S-box protein [Methanospirillum sp.]|uniref:PAS domain S-box protein n=1 Tax=Methanospirillum sp. TaxID=45200 RepID=UPI0023693960|nr:PAS domain S-box protein [Methanospirillum sp.]MDD1729732.1 PAS domain S-box protein [Methanospirillum sp.]